MPENPALSSSPQNLKISTLSSQPQLKTPIILKTSCCSKVMLGVTISLAMTAIYLPLSSQPALATDLKLRPQTSAIEVENPIFPLKSLSSSAGWQEQSAALLPPLFNVIASIKTQLVNLSLVSQENSQREFVVSSAGAREKSFGSSFLPFPNNLSKNTSLKDFLTTDINSKSSSLISASTTLVAQPKPKLYTVKAGDTVSKIAKRHRVSRGELIKLNNIKNSHIIFVNQQLKIPPKIEDSSPTSFTLEQPEKVITSLGFTNNTNSHLSHKSSKLLANAPDANSGSKSLKQSAANQPSKLSIQSNNHYVAKLRAEIDRLRSQYQDKIRLGKDDQELDSNSPSRSSIDGANNPVVPRADNQDISTQKISVAPIKNSRQSLESDSLEKEITSLQLPPLAASEHYLPSTFDGYIWPAKGVLTSGFGWRWGRLHGGIDIAAPIGTPVLAAASGEVVTAGWHSGGYGNLVKIRHLDNSVTLYAHNNRILVNLGQRVNKGEQIAEIGNTGYSTGPHLHFEIHPKGSGAVNPLALLSGQ